MFNRPQSVSDSQSEQSDMEMKEKEDPQPGGFQALANLNLAKSRFSDSDLGNFSNHLSRFLSRGGTPVHR